MGDSPDYVSTLKANREQMKRAVLRLHRFGLNVAPRSLYDDLTRTLGIIGPRTGYTHRLSLWQLEQIDDPLRWVRSREACLIALGWHRVQREWFLESDKESDGDRYIWSYHLANRMTGQRVELDVSPNEGALLTDEARLFALLKFPTREKTGRIGPVCVTDLEKAVFGRYA